MVRGEREKTRDMTSRASARARLSRATPELTRRQQCAQQKEEG